jgi:hypothetical protein
VRRHRDGGWVRLVWIDVKELCGGGHNKIPAAHSSLVGAWTADFRDRKTAANLLRQPVWNFGVTRHCFYRASVGVYPQ